MWTWLELKTPYHKLHRLLTNRSLKPSLHILDNECQNVLKKVMREVNEKIQLVPPNTHHRSSAEQAIWNFKEHFIFVLASTHKDITLNLWCQLLPHASLKLSLIRQLRMKPKRYWYEQLHEEFNYNATPLNPPGTKIIVHEKPTVGGTWASHGVKGWYLGPSMEDYSCHCVHITKKRGERDSDCVNFFHTILHSLTILPQKMSSLRRKIWPMPYRTQQPKRHFLTYATP